MHENGSGGGPERDGPLLRARGIDKSYGAVQALKGVDFEVRPSEVVALIGDNGAGKSTLINVITGAFLPDSGEIVFEGGQPQGVAVAGAVMWAIKVVIMGEPTAALGVAQAGMVLDLVRRVRETGIPVVFISHNMPQVFDVADRVVVLRLGEVVAELDPEKTSTDDAVAAMTGSLHGEGSA